MTALLAPGRTPQNDAELARSFHDRLRKLETASTVRVGPWVLSNDPATGNLRATRPGQTVVIDESGSTEVLDAASLNLSGYVTDKELVDALSQIDTGGSLESMWSDLYTALTGLLNPVNALQALANFFKVELGSPITSNRLPLIPLSHIRPVNPNLLLDGSFDDEATLSGFPDWDYDEADGRSRPGSAYTMADGLTHTIRSNAVEVEADDELDAEVYAKWVGLVVSAATPIQLAIASYDENDVLIGGAPAVVASAGAAGNSGGTGGWGTKLSVTGWSPPANAKYVVVELTVTTGATGGTVKYDDAALRKTGTLPQSYINGLVDALQGLWNGVQARIDDFMDLLDAFGGFVIGSGQGQLTDVITRLQALNPLTGVFDASKLGNLANIPAIGQDKIIGLVDDLADAVANGGQTVRNAIVQALTGAVPPGGATDANVISALTSIPATLVQSAVEGASSIDDAIQQALNAVVQGASGVLSAPGTFVDIINQLAGMRNSTAGANAAVVNLQAQVAGLDPAASSEVINFGEFANAGAPPSMFTKFSDNGSGTLITSNGQLAWDSANAGRELYLFNGGPLQTDLFEVSVVLPQVPTHGWFGADSSNYIWLIGRSNAGSTALVAARLAWDEIRLYNLAGGTFTQFGPTISESDILTAGCSVSFKGGTVAEPRYFHVAINGTKKLVYTDGSAGAPVTVLGSDYRNCGMGVEKGSSYLTGTISTWSMYDGGSSAGSGVVAGYTAAGLTNLNLWKGTAAQYAAIATKNANTIYVVKN
ncbi:minor tail protein [Mycobacterium phage Zemanar]|uniref:Structural protein n=1 Tax=Mycobacterium phage Zemanar TaxID=1034151 RepID=G1BPD9_9CAUD|nr:minor tail protein [Mycobacterium phage Zemanar]AEJ95703.1 structural protein [Mycobacterium phage Zemanar]